MKKVDEFTGIYLDLSSFDSQMVEWRKQGAKCKHYTDIRVRVNDEIKDYTLEEFKNILGFKETK